MHALKELFLSFTLLLFVCLPVKADSLFDGLALVDVDEQPASLESYQGKVVLLNFWATWCPPCIKEMPSMQRLRDHFQDQAFEVVAVNVGESPTTVSSFLLELDTELTFPILLDQEARSFGQLGLRGLPMTLLLDQNGNVLEKILGGRDWDSPNSLQVIADAIKRAP